MIKSTIASYRFLKLSPRFWTPAFRDRLLARRPAQQVYVIERQSDVRAMLEAMRGRTVQR